MSSKTWESFHWFEVGESGIEPPLHHDMISHYKILLVGFSGCELFLLLEGDLGESGLIHLVVETPQLPGTSHGNTPQHGNK